VLRRPRLLRSFRSGFRGWIDSGVLRPAMALPNRRRACGRDAGFCRCWSGRRMHAGGSRTRLAVQSLAAEAESAYGQSTPMPRNLNSYIDENPIASRGSAVIIKGAGQTLKIQPGNFGNVLTIWAGMLVIFQRCAGPGVARLQALEFSGRLVPQRRTPREEGGVMLQRC
jgi:hypothetical protein